MCRKKIECLKHIVEDCLSDRSDTLVGSFDQGFQVSLLQAHEDLDMKIIPAL